MQTDRDVVRGWVIDLVAKCPRRNPLPDCPAIEIRRSPIRERVSLVEKMPDWEIDAILGHHRKCIAGQGRASPS
jgi:hypothetical protein